MLNKPKMMLKLLLVALMISLSSCAGPQPATKRSLETLPVVKFEQIAEPQAPSELNAVAVTVNGKEYVAFEPKKASDLRVYIKELQSALKKANITIDESNAYLRKIHGH